MRGSVLGSVTLALTLATGSAVALPAFPGAQGFGAAASGGRGGQVIKVTSLAESGPGSLAEALATPGPRIIVFDVSGVIDLGPPNASDPSPPPKSRTRKGEPDPTVGSAATNRREKRFASGKVMRRSHPS